MTALPIDPDRFLGDLHRLRGIGRVGTGVVRPAFSDADIEARRWLIAQLEAAGLTPSVDAWGNVFGMPPGADRPILLGSHTDSQPEGGWLDGALGVAAALEVARAAQEANGPPVAVVSFQDEEGRFGGLTGSRIWTGALSTTEADALTDTGGVTLAEARAAAAPLVRGAVPSPGDFAAFIELHIEQGPVLDEAGESVGVVESIVGTREASVTLTGEQNHAGTTPMARRKDAFAGLAAFAQALPAAFKDTVTPQTVWTIGHVEIAPNAASIVPGCARFSVQWRDPSRARLDAMAEIVEAQMRRVAAERGLTLDYDMLWRIEPTEMNAALVERLATAAERVAPGGWRRMHSGALHDAAVLSPHMPTAMLFCASIGGLSHCFEEDSKPGDLVMSLRVLAEAVASFA